MSVRTQGQNRSLDMKWFTKLIFSVSQLPIEIIMFKSFNCWNESEEVSWRSLEIMIINRAANTGYLNIESIITWMCSQQIRWGSWQSQETRPLSLMNLSGSTVLPQEAQNLKLRGLRLTKEADPWTKKNTERTLMDLYVSRTYNTVTWGDIFVLWRLVLIWDKGQCISK